MRNCSLHLLLATALGGGLLSGCDGKGHEEIGEQLDRRQVDTYEDEVPVEPGPEVGLEATPAD